MGDQGEFDIHDTRPITGTPQRSVPPQEFVDSRNNPGTAIGPNLGSHPGLPAVRPPSVPVASTPPGWYPVAGGQRYWDGYRWTEHYLWVAAPVLQATYVPPMVTTDARTSGVEVTFAWILTILTLGYLLPWAIAATRGKSNSGAVGLVNFLLGWTFLGWLAALVMACMPHQVAVVHHRM